MNSWNVYELVARMLKARFEALGKAGESSERETAEFFPSRSWGGRPFLVDPEELYEALSRLIDRRTDPSDTLLFGGVETDSRRQIAGPAAKVRAERYAELERELGRKETQLISARRETVIARREAEHLKAENIRLVEHLGDLSTTLRTVSHVVAEKKEGQAILQESHKGIVVAVLGDEVAVQYRVGDHCVEQVYERGQFVNGKLPSVGDMLEACVLVLRKANDGKRVETELSDEFGSFQRRGVEGPFKI